MRIHGAHKNDLWAKFYDSLTVKNQSHITADGQAVSHSWCCTPSRGHDKILKLKYDTVLKGRIQGGSVRKTTRLMLCGEIMAIYCKNHVEDTLCGQGAEFLLLSLVIHTVPTWV